MPATIVEAPLPQGSSGVRAGGHLAIASAVLLIAGLALVAWTAWSIFGVPRAPYRYALVASGAADAFPDLGLGERGTFAIERYELRADEAQDALATVDLGRADDGTPVLLEWHSALAEPLITVTAPLAEVLALADAVTGHAGDDASVLAWWDSSRRLALFGGIDVRFRDNLVRPLLLPAAWESRRSAARTVEAKLWQIDGNQTDDFDVFLDALAAPVTEGVARLRALAGDRHAHVAVHVTDAYRLGAERPARFGIGYKDFPNTGQLHGVVRGVKAWLREQGYDAYLVVPHADTAIRVYFLTDAASADTLLARMLPFTTSNPLQLEEPRVVGNYGGFWVYDLDGAGG